jgi:hypothetical protein
MIARLRAEVGSPAPWPWPDFFAGVTATAALAWAGGAGSVSGGGWPGDGAFLDDRQPADGVVFHVDVQDAVLGLAELLGHAQQVGGVQRGGLPGQAAHQVGVADDRDAVPDHGLAGNREFAVAALLARHVDDDAAGLHALHHLGGDEPRCGFARNQSGGDDDVRVLGLLRVHLALGLLEALAHHLGIAAAARAFFLVIDLDELAAQRHDLVGHFGACVVGAHDRAQVGGRADGRQAGDTGTGDKNLGRRNLARRGDLAIEEPAERVGSLDDGAIAADAGHGGQGVHLLGAGELARQGVDGQHREFAVGQLLHQLRVLRRPDEADQRAARPHECDLFGRRGAHLEDDVGATQQLCSATYDLGAGRLVGVVGEICISTGT